MNNFLKRTKMMSEAKEKGNPRFLSYEILAFWCVFFLSGILQTVVYSIGLMRYVYSDPAVQQMLHSDSLELTEFLNRFVELLSIAPEWLGILMLLSTVLIIVSVLIYCKMIDKRPISSIGIRKGTALKDIFFGLLLGAVLISAVVILGLLTDTFTFNGRSSISVSVLFAYFVGYAVAAFSEEILFRGYLLSAIGKNKGVGYSVLLSSAVYVFIQCMGMTSDMFYILNVAIYAIFACVYVVKRGNIWGVFAFRFIWTFMSAILFGLNNSGTPFSSSVLNISSVSGFEIVTGGILVPDDGLFATLALFIALGIALKISQNKNEISEVEGETDEKTE